MQTILKHPYKDNPTFLKVFKYCISQVECDYIYGFINNVSQALVAYTTTKPYIIIGIDDISDEEYYKSLYNTISRICTLNPNTTVIIIDEYLNIESPLLIKIENLCHLHISNLTLDIPYYKQVSKIDKKFNSSKIGVCFNNQDRIHRLINLSLIYDLKLDSYIFCTGKIMYDSIMEVVDWNFETKTEISIRDKMINGFNKLRENGVDPIPPYPLEHGFTNDLNPVNFDLYLRPIYENTMIEIIPETQCYNINRFDTAHTNIVTEKTVNSILARNFPIWISGHHTVKYLREFVGLDVFDDIIDHSYDNETDPLTRIYKATNDNQHLFRDPNLQSLWEQNQHRFESNINIILNDICDLYYDTAIAKFTKTVDKN